MKIDIVITWVDGSDPFWIEERNKYSAREDDKNIIRFRDMGLLRYWFRGIEKFAPWVNNIYFITYGHYPDWLNLNNPKLKIINHKDYIPSNYLPTFSSHTIELNLHNIEGLSEHFIYFNDDMFLTDYTKINDFFIDDLPVGVAVMNAISPMDTLLNNVIINNLKIINKHFDKNETLKNKKNWLSLKYGKELLRNILFKYWHGFLGFQNYHGPSALLKSTLDEIWSIEGKELDKTCKNKFRQKEDLNQWLFLYWQYASNRFVAGYKKNIRYFELSNDVHEIVNAILKHKYKTICINDSEIEGNYEEIQEELRKAFEKILPEKSKFEI